MPSTCLLILVLGPVFLRLLWAIDRTPVTITQGANTLVAEVNGATLEVPPDSLSGVQKESQHITARLYTQAPDSSLYWQPSQGGLFGFVGAAGEWLQALRPQAKWSAHSGSIDPGRPGTAFIAVLTGGRLPANIDYVDAATGKAVLRLVVHPEGRTLTWLRPDLPEDEAQVARGYYRPRGWTSVDGFASEIVLALITASALCLLAWLVGALAARQKAGEPAGVLSVARLRPARALWNRPYVPAIVLFLAGTIVAVAAAVCVLNGIAHVQDEVGYLFQGRIFALGRSYVPTPPAPEFFANGFIQMFDGKWFAKYPPGFPLLLVPGLWAGVPWLIDPLCSGVSLALIYASGLKMFGRHVAAWAVLLGLVSPWMIFMSGSYMSHPSTMMWTAIFLYAVICTKTSSKQAPATGDAQSTAPELRSFLLSIVHSPSSVVWPLLAGFALGMAFITRQWTAAGIGVGAALWVLGDIALAGRGWWRTFGRYSLILLGMVPPVLFILYENRQLTGDWLRFTQDLVGSYDRPGFGPGHGDAQGHTPALGVYNALVYWRSLGSMFDGWPVPLSLVPLLLGVVAWAGDRARRLLGWDALLWLGTLGLVGAYFVWWSNTTIFGPRYWYEALPFMLLVAGRGLDLLGKVAAAAARQQWTASRLRWLVPGALFAVLTFYTLTQSIPFWVSAYKDYNGISAEPLQAAQRADLKNALIFVQLDPAKPNRDYGKVFPANDPLLRGDRVYARDLGPQKNRGLLGYFPGRQPYYLPLDGPPRPGFGP